MNIYTTGNIVYLFNEEKDYIIDAVITNINDEDNKLTYNLYPLHGENVMLRNVPSEMIFSSFDDCFKYAITQYEQRLKLNTLLISEKSPYNQRTGDADPLVNLIRDFLIDKKSLVGLEIGSYQGESTDLFIRSEAFKTLYCIDPWECNYDSQDKSSDERLKAAEQMFDKRFKDSKIVKKIKAKSIDVVNQFDKESLDFIYIDGCHTYEAVKEDLKNYVPKVKKGGIIAGHDYDIKQQIPHIIGVKKAIDEYFKTKPLKVYEDNSWVYIKE